MLMVFPARVMDLVRGERGKGPGKKKGRKSIVPVVDLRRIESIDLMTW